jgi:hypothetical protein
LKEVVSQASALAYLQNPKSPTAALNEGSVRDAARTLGIKLDVIHASTEVELDKAFETIAALGSRGIIVEGEHTSTADASAPLHPPPNTLSRGAILGESMRCSEAP